MARIGAGDSRHLVARTKRRFLISFWEDTVAGNIKPKKPKVHTLRFIDITDLPNHESLLEHDLRLTIGEGLSLYTAHESLKEISRHHDTSYSDSNYSAMMRIIQDLPEGVLICWGG